MSPIHPAVVHLPIGLTISSVVADSAAMIGNWQSLASAGAWMMLGAALGAAVAAPAGYYDMKRDALTERTHQLVHLHQRLGWTIVGGLWVLVVWRWFGAGVQASPSAGYLIVAWLLLVLVLFQGWFGGEMVYGHGAGVAPTGQGQQPAETAARPALRVYRLITRRSAGEGHGR